MDNNSGLIAGVMQWWAKPFDPSGSALNWLLWVGILVIGWWLWNTVILMVEETRIEV
jgi:hypothetical protein